MMLSFSCNFEGPLSTYYHGSGLTISRDEIDGNEVYEVDSQWFPLLRKHVSVALLLITYKSSIIRDILIFSIRILILEMVSASQ